MLGFSRYFRFDIARAILHFGDFRDDFRRVKIPSHSNNAFLFKSFRRTTEAWFWYWYYRAAWYIIFIYYHYWYRHVISYMRFIFDFACCSPNVRGLEQGFNISFRIECYFIERTPLFHYYFYWIHLIMEAFRWKISLDYFNKFSQISNTSRTFSRAFRSFQEWFDICFMNRNTILPFYFRSLIHIYAYIIIIDYF